MIEPSLISARIISLLDESAERVILVSPYMKISKWYKFLNKINDLKSNGIHLDIFVRDDPDNAATYRDLDQLKLTYKKIPHLHTKLYMNEKNGIVTSMNLLLSSEINSLEIGYITETWEEYNDLLNYFNWYIGLNETKSYGTIVNQSVAGLKEIMQSIRREFIRFPNNLWLWLALNTLNISTGEKYYNVSIYDGYLRITANLRPDFKTEQHAIHCISIITKKLRDLTALKMEMNPISKINTTSGSITNAYYSKKHDKLQLTAISQNKLRSSSLNLILKDEAAYVVEIVTCFIKIVDDLENQQRN